MFRLSQKPKAYDYETLTFSYYTNTIKMNTDNDDTTMIKLKSMADENGKTEEFYISMAAAQISDLIKDASGDPDDQDDDDDDDNKTVEIEVSRVKGPCLAKVVDFMKHHHEEKMKEIPTPLGGSTFNEVGFETHHRDLKVATV